MLLRSNHLKIEFSPRDRRFTLVVGLLVLMTGLGMMGSNWRTDTFAPLAIMMGLFLICLVALIGFKRTS